MNKKVYIIITVALLIAIGIIFKGDIKTQPAQKVEVKNGIQYITIEAKGGYSPQVTTAKSGIPTKLIMKTSGTYDCSSSLVIHSIGLQKILPQNGKTEIDLGIPKTGEPVRGVCGMGMYNFSINFD